MNTMKKLLAALLFVLAFAIGASAQSTMTITVGQIDIGPAPGMHLNVYSLPLTIGGNSGTAWFYPQPCNSYGVCGWILFRPPLEGPNNNPLAIVTSWVPNSFNSIGQVTSATVTYTFQGDPNIDGDTDAGTGSITFNFSYSWGKVGRYAFGWIETITGGSGAQSITQD
jgi:hypothetical protein